MLNSFTNTTTSILTISYVMGLKFVDYVICKCCIKRLIVVYSNAIKKENKFYLICHVRVSLESNVA